MNEIVKYVRDFNKKLLYRKKVLYGKAKEIISTLCKYKDVHIIAGAICIDYVHLSVVIPLKISVSQFMRYLKGKVH